MSLPQQPTFEDLELLAEVAQLLAMREGNNVLEKVMQLAAKSVGAMQGGALIYDSSDLAWTEVHTERDLSLEEVLEKINRVNSEGLAGWVRRNQEGAIVADTLQDERWYHYPGEKASVRSAVCVPIMVKEEVLGVMTLVHPDPDYFNTYHLRLLTIIASQTATSIRSAQAFNRLHAQQRQLEAVLHAIPDPLLVLDERGHVLLVSDAVVMLANGMNLDSLIGLSIYHLADLDAVFQPICKVLDEPLYAYENWSFEARSEQRSRDFLINVSVWENKEQHSAGYVVVLNDITALSNLSRFKDKMLHLVSHDLRAPLALITGYADMLDMDIDPASPMKSFVEAIKRSSERMYKLLDSMLRVEKIRSSPIELHENITMNDLAHTVLKDSEPLAATKHIVLEDRIQHDQEAVVFGDAVLLQQSMENLVNNAIKYTPDGGRVTILTDTEEGRFYFTVRDTGVGIPRDDLPFIFESFYRSEQTRQIDGIGLGLSLVKNVIEQHGGYIWAESEPGEGSQFSFWLPLI